MGTNRAKCFAHARPILLHPAFPICRPIRGTQVNDNHG
jgi:hypothetical protein